MIRDKIDELEHAWIDADKEHPHRGFALPSDEQKKLELWANGALVFVQYDMEARMGLPVTGQEQHAFPADPYERIYGLFADLTGRIGPIVTNAEPFEKQLVRSDSNVMCVALY